MFFRLFWDGEVGTKIATRNSIELWWKASLWPLKDLKPRDTRGRCNLPAIEKNVFPGVAFLWKKTVVCLSPLPELPVWAGLWQARGTRVSDGSYCWFVRSFSRRENKHNYYQCHYLLFCFVATLRAAPSEPLGAAPLAVGLCLEDVWNAARLWYQLWLLRQAAEWCLWEVILSECSATDAQLTEADSLGTRWGCQQAQQEKGGTGCGGFSHSPSTCHQTPLTLSSDTRS